MKYPMTMVDVRIGSATGESFDFNAKKYTEIIKENNEWFISAFPNGDYYIFVSKDFKNVWVGHQWDQTITLIGKYFCRKGKKIISKFEKIHIFEIKETIISPFVLKRVG